MAATAAGRKMSTYVLGVGMTKFCRPMTRDWDYPDMGREAGAAALADAGIHYNHVEAVVASYCYGESTSGQRAVYNLGLSGVPVFNVNNNCSSASSALMLARILVKSGYNCVLALGFEKMEGGLTETFTDRTSPIHRHTERMAQLGAESGLVKPGFNNFTSDVIKMFAYAAREYRDKYPGKMTDDLLVNVALKNRRHGYNNPLASLNSQTSYEKIADKNKEICEPITSGMCALTADGGAAAVVCSDQFLESRDQRSRDRAIEIIGQQMVTDLPSSFDGGFSDVCGCSLAKLAADRIYRETGLSVRDVDVIELHDCFSCNEVFMYEALQLAPEGKGCDLFRSGEWYKNSSGGELYKLGNRWVVNPSGGLESKGHPIGATGLGQCAELVWQLRGEAGRRQVEGARVALQHNFGIGGAAVVTMYKNQKLATKSKL